MITVTSGEMLLPSTSKGGRLEVSFPVYGYIRLGVRGTLFRGCRPLPLIIQGIGCW